MPEPRQEPEGTSATKAKNERSRFKAVPASSLGLTHPRRTKLQHGTFLRFGHPRL